MRARTHPDIVKLGNPQSAVNQFGLVRELRGPEYKQIATPNNDTIYAQAFCDVSREPLILSVCQRHIESDPGLSRSAVSI